MSSEFSIVARRLGLWSSVAAGVLLIAWAPSAAKPLSLAAVVFMGLFSGLTCVVHFSILTLSRRPEFAGEPWMPLVMSFRWPSVVYALDILAWDVFFALAMLFAAPVFGGSRLARGVRWTMTASGVLALGGLLGVVQGDMQQRNLGIVGYVVVFFAVTVLLAVLFFRSEPRAAGAGEAGRSAP
ncbi:MAG TPA: hypothetical protein PLQ13_06535 [Candidatus Krumholzibacteria bacterium]|nr:hypothetical protein [Candidatus Krumholzibacteria bacterium]